MMRRIAIALLVLAGTAAVYPSAPAQKNDAGENKRKVVNRVLPSYPEMARTMQLSGVVKIEAVVGSDGTPKEVDVKGGHPVLVQAAVDAVHKWRWAPSSHETKEPIEVNFAPSLR
jgi:TonB family protein